MKNANPVSFFVRHFRYVCTGRIRCRTVTGGLSSAPALSLIRDHKHLSLHVGMKVAPEGVCLATFVRTGGRFGEVEDHRLSWVHSVHIGTLSFSQSAVPLNRHF